MNKARSYTDRINRYNSMCHYWAWPFVILALWQNSLSK